MVRYGIDQRPLAMGSKPRLVAIVDLLQARCGQAEEKPRLLTKRYGIDQRLVRLSSTILIINK